MCLIEWKVPGWLARTYGTYGIPNILMFAIHPHRSLSIQTPSSIWVWCRFCGLNMQIKKKNIKNSQGEVFGQRFCLLWGDSLPIKLIRGSDISALLSLHCRDVTADSKYSTRNSGPDATGVQAAEPSESDAVRGMFCPNPKREHQSKHEWSHSGQIRERWEIFFSFFFY